MRKKSRIRSIVVIIGCLFLLNGCQRKENSERKQPVDGKNTEVEVVCNIRTTKASGVKVKENDEAIIDYSNSRDGYIMVHYKENTTKKIKAQVTGPSEVTYTYNIRMDGYEVLPLSEGSGKYEVTVYENIKDTSYAKVLALEFSTELEDEFSPYLTPNQYVNFSEDTTVVRRAAKLCAGQTDPLEKIKIIYNYVIKNFTYDMEKAETVQSGYLPDLEQIYKEKSGICFDYAATMVAMLRSQNVATKLVIGYSGSAYHAWVNVYSDESGWVVGAIYFDGKEWSLMDPTFASTGNSSAEIMEYIGNKDNYLEKYVY